MKRKLLCIVLSLLLLFSIPGFSLAYTDLSGNDNHSAKLIASRDIDDGDEGDKDEDDADDNEEDEEDKR